MSQINEANEGSCRTAKGIHHQGLNIHWRLLCRFLVLASFTILALIKVFAFDHTDLMADGGAMNVFWAWYNLLVLTVCCLACIEQPRHRLDERFSASEKAVIKLGDRAHLFDVKDVSASGMRLAGQILDPIGSPVTVIMDRIESPAVLVRRGTEEFAIRFLGDEAREAMTRHVYSEQYGRPIEEVQPSRVLAGILHRLAR